MEKIFDYIIHYSLLIIIFLFPFLFLPFTQEFFLTNKLYLLAFSVLFLLLISTIKITAIKKISWQKRSFDNLLVLFLLSFAISIVISSPNKVQALLNPNFGFLTFFSLTVLYFYLSRNIGIGDNRLEKRICCDLSLPILSISSFFLSIITIIFFFQPFKNVDLPQYLQFLKNPGFTPIGSQLDLAIFLGFFVGYGLIEILEKQRINKDKQLIFKFSLLTFNLIALSITLYSLLKPISTSSNQFQPVSTNLPPFRLSWYAAVEILKNPITAFFGVGVDNFASIFTRVKDIAYNQSPLWQFYSFNYSRSAILHLFTETGFFGFLVFSFFIFSILKQLIFPHLHQSSSIYINIHKSLSISFIYLLICLFLFPPSLIIWFLLFLVIAKISQISDRDVVNQVSTNLTKKIDLTELLPFYITTIVFSLIFLLGFGYLLGRSYAAEYYFKQSLISKSINEIYKKQFKAIQLNPYIEKFHREYAFLNLNIALNITLKELQKMSEEKNIEKNKQKIEELKLEFYSLVNQAINEGKWLIKLNSQNSINWASLAEIYRSIIGQAEKADIFSISSYQRAIVADPQNPTYRLNLGGIYYSLGNFEEATKIFEQAVVLKPDWPNAYYNLAWANFQKQNYQAAVAAMENVTRLLDPKKYRADYEKAKKELEEFKKKLPKEEKQISEEQKNQPFLTLPSPIPSITPQIQLPKEASPEAKY